MKHITLKGRVACKPLTKLQGIVFLCPEDLRNFATNTVKIFVAQDTSINDMAMIKEADAVLTERGGLLSHAAIVCRELNKPCVVAINDVYRSVQTGDFVDIDFTTGKLTINKRM